MMAFSRVRFLDLSDVSVLEVQTSVMKEVFQLYSKKTFAIRELLFMDIIT